MEHQVPQEQVEQQVHQGLVVLMVLQGLLVQVESMVHPEHLEQVV